MLPLQSKRHGFNDTYLNSCGKTGTRQLFLICVKTRTRVARRVLALDTGDEDFFSSTMEFLGKLSSPILSFPTVMKTGDCWGSKTLSSSILLCLFLHRLVLGTALLLVLMFSLRCWWQIEEIYPGFSLLRGSASFSTQYSAAAADLLCVHVQGQLCHSDLLRLAEAFSSLSIF